jgi:hypothetical protein
VRTLGLHEEIGFPGDFRLFWEMGVHNGSVMERLAAARRSIPKGLCPPAQGCEARATLGFGPESLRDKTPSKSAALVHGPENQANLLSGHQLPGSTAFSTFSADENLDPGNRLLEQPVLLSLI